jgi:protein TIF31
VQRLRELLSGGQADPSSLGVDGGISVHDAVKNPELWHREAAASASGAAAQKGKASKAQLAQQSAAEEAAQAQYKTPFLDWSGWAASPMSSLIPEQARAPRAFAPCLRTLAVAPWNPPPHYLRIQGHLLYLHVATLEGEHIFITATTHGFYINRSTSFTFDPSPRDEPYYSCSLFDILCGYSKLFLANFARLFQDPVSQRDYYAVVPIANCLPAHPWLARVHAHTPDALRSQAAFLLTGATSPDTLEGTRDWNDELQSTRELPRATLAERLVRDRVLNRAYAEFTLAAVRAVPRVAGGEVQAMNPMDRPDARMYLCNNLFLSKGADGVDIYPHMGGDEAAHVAVSKDLHGIRALSNLDVEGLCLLGTVVVDWKGERWVAQSVVPGLFRRRDEDELEEGVESKPKADSAAATESAGAIGKIDPKEDTQVVYGGVEGPEVIRTDASFHKLFGKVAEALHLARHEVPDAEGEKKDLWLSVDSKGLRGADGRKYALDLARLNPVDIEWLERDIDGPLVTGDAASAPGAYPHRMTLLRQELLEVYYDAEFRKWAREQLAARTAENEAKAEAEKPAADAEAKEGEEKAEAAADAGEAEASTKAPEPTIDPSQFKLAFNPDAFVEFKGVAAGAPAKALITDESEPSVAAVRAAARYLRDAAIPRLVTDVASGLFAAQDGSTLTRQLHVRHQRALPRLRGAALRAGEQGQA